MDLRELLQEYKEYSKRNGLKPFYHRTHLALMVKKLSELIVKCSHSNDLATDEFTEAVRRLTNMYSLLEENVQNYHDSSEVYTYKEKEIPELYAGLLVDLLIQILIYVGGNNFEELFMTTLENKLLIDKRKTPPNISRFYNKRIGWK